MSDSEFIVTNSPPVDQIREVINAHSSTVRPPSIEERLPSTAKKDVVDAIYEIEDKGKTSKFLMGHISTHLLEDTFLLKEE